MIPAKLFTIPSEFMLLSLTGWKIFFLTLLDAVLSFHFKLQLIYSDFQIYVPKIPQIKVVPPVYLQIDSSCNPSLEKRRYLINLGNFHLNNIQPPKFSISYGLIGTETKFSIKSSDYCSHMWRYTHLAAISTMTILQKNIQTKSECCIYPLKPHIK